MHTTSRQPTRTTPQTRFNPTTSNMKLVLTVALAAAVASAVTAADPQIKVNSAGKLVSVVDGEIFDHGDMASLRTQRATSENVVDLMKEMITGNKEMVKSTDALVRTWFLVQLIPFAKRAS